MIGKKASGQDPAAALANLIANYNIIRIGLSVDKYMEESTKKASEGIAVPAGEMVDLIMDKKKAKKNVIEITFSALSKFRSFLASLDLMDILPQDLLIDGDTVVSKYNALKLPRLDSALDKKSLAAYMQLTKANDKTVADLMKDLEEWNLRVAQASPTIANVIKMLSLKEEPAPP